MKNRREHLRYEAAVAAEIELRGETLEGETRDISEGGASVVFSTAIPDDSRIALTLILMQDGIEDPHQEPFTAQASVMWSAPQDDGRTMLGVRFASVTAAQKTQLKSFLAALKPRGE
jgi:c-di-GMP-binding flagellar brake protein YcgR